MKLVKTSAMDACAPASAPQHGPSMPPGGPVIEGSRDGAASFGAVAEAYLRQYQGRDPTREQRVTWWVRQFGDRPMAAVLDTDVRAAMRLLARTPTQHYAGRGLVNGRSEKVFRPGAKPMTGSTINRYLAALQSVMAFADERDLMTQGWINPCTRAIKPAENPHKLRYLDKDECARLLTACRKQPWPLLYSIVLMALSTGSRRSELTQLRWRDVDLDRAEIRLLETKNGTSRVSPLSPEAVVELKRHAKGKTPDRLVFPSVRNPGRAFDFQHLWERALAAAGIKGATFHSLRHSCASHIVLGGGSLAEVAELLGHKSISMSARYAHLDSAAKARTVSRHLSSFAPPEPASHLRASEVGRRSRANSIGWRHAVGSRPRCDRRCGRGPACAGAGGRAPGVAGHFG